MRLRHHLIAALLGAAGGFAGGWFAASVWSTPAADTTAAPRATPPRDTAGSAPAMRGDADTRATRRVEQRMRALTPADRMQAAIACIRSPDEDERLVCLSVLGQSSMEDAQVRTAVLGALAAESDPARKAQILDALTPVPLPPDDLAPLLEQIAALGRSPDPELRGQGLIRSAQWDRRPDTEARLRAGLYDPDPAVVRSAITALQVSGVRSNEAKEALLVLANDADPGSEIQSNAVEAIRTLPLSREDYALYRSAADKLQAARGDAR